VPRSLAGTEKGALNHCKRKKRRGKAKIPRDRGEGPGFGLAPGGGKVLPLRFQTRRGIEGKVKRMKGLSAWRADKLRGGSRSGYLDRRTWKHEEKTMASPT